MPLYRHSSSHYLVQSLAGIYTRRTLIRCLHGPTQVTQLHINNEIPSRANGDIDIHHAKHNSHPNHTCGPCNPHWHPRSRSRHLRPILQRATSFFHHERQRNRRAFSWSRAGPRTTPEEQQRRLGGVHDLRRPELFDQDRER